MIGRFAVRAFCLLALSVPLLAQGQGHMGHGIEKNLIFPHFVLSQNFSTQLILLNPQPGTEVTGNLLFFAQDGTPLQVVDGGQTVDQVAVTLPPGGVDFVTVTGTTADLTIGWALLEIAAPGQGQSDRRERVAGSVLFTNTAGAGGSAVGSVGVVVGRYQTGGHRKITVPVVIQGDTMLTSIAAVNAGSEAMNLTFELRDATGTVVEDTATIDPPVSPLAAGHQFARFVHELFPDHDFGDDFQGTLTVSSDKEGLVLTGLISNGTLLTSIPVFNFPPSGGGGPQTHTVTNTGFTFTPAELTINVGDTVTWSIADIHNVIEVDEATWTANGNTAKTGGFSTAFGGGSVTFNTAGVYFYVCSPHASGGMKGKITVQAQ